MTDSVIPQQWLTLPLEEVILRIVGGGTPSKSKPEYYQGEIPWMSVKDMNKHVLEDTVDHISQDAVNNSSTNVIPAGTPIIATRMSLGKIVVANFDSAINQDLKALFLPADIHRDYLVYWYRSVARKVELMGTGTTVKGIRLEALKGLEFALPSFAEQKAITDKLDTLLAQVENTKARLERIPKILKRFRQSVLAAAVSGCLTDDVEMGDESWSPTKLANLCTTAFDGPFGSKLKSSDYTNGGVGVVRLENIRHLEFDHSKETFINEDKYQTLIKNKLEKNDILFSSFVDEEVRACLFPFETLRFINKADCFCLRIDQRKALPEFVLYLLTSQISYAQIKEHVQGVTRPRVNLKILKSLELPVPPLEKQAEVVRRVNQLFAHADRIEQQVNNALARVNNLTQSILAKAFRGELTEQWRKDNPELISGENSAEALLERIKAERAINQPKKKLRNGVTS